MLDIIEETNEGLKMVVRVSSPLGLHARPAAALAREAQNFTAEITFEAEGVRADAKSMLDILSLAATSGTPLTLTARGDDAREALDRLGGMIAGVER